MNNQQVSQILTFYRINFGFHDPFKFLLDGNFIKLIVQKQIDFKKRLQNAITGKIKFYVPSCLIRELQLLGADFKIVLEKAKQFRKVSCKHPLEVSVDQCITQNLIGEQNPQKYIVCTQDIELRRNLRQILNCPLMYFGPDQRIKFQDVHKKNLVLIQQQSKKKLLPKQNEMGQIIEYKRQEKQKQIQEQKKEKLKLASQFGLKVKNKLAKGPNPLSIKKKKVKYEQKKKQQTDLENKIDNQKKKRIRKKKNKGINKTNGNENQNQNIEQEQVEV